MIQDAASYRGVLERLERLETIAAVKEGLQDVAAGRVRPEREVLAALATKHGLRPAKGG